MAHEQIPKDMMNDFGGHVERNNKKNNQNEMGILKLNT